MLLERRHKFSSKEPLTVIDCGRTLLISRETCSCHRTEGGAELPVEWI